MNINFQTGLAFMACLFAAAANADPALTIYNQEFAVVRENIPLVLQSGENRIECSEITAHLEPDSVILRDPAGKYSLQILEQNYRADPISQGLLLSLYEGKTIDFLVQRPDVQEVVQGRIIRSGYVPHTSAMGRYNDQYGMQQSARAYGPGGEPVIEVNGQVRFGLPGQPLFPSLTQDTILEPTLNWLVYADQAGQLDAELCYVTGGMSWAASYNLVAPESGNTLDIVGWVTMDNQSARTFDNARIKLMAGDVSKLRDGSRTYNLNNPAGAVSMDRPMGYLAVTENAFDEYHLYTLERPTTLRDRETKQVEFLRADGVAAERFYVYDGAKIDSDRYRGWSSENIRKTPEYGTESNTKVWTMCEFKNTQENGLGIPLPKGRTRFYRRDADGQLEFTGENIIDHTPRDESVRVYMGNAFDLVGDRRRTDFKINHEKPFIDESFEITLRNHKDQIAEIRVVEHLYRGKTWEITQSSNTHLKLDSQMIEFRIQIEPKGETILTYAVHYTW